MRKKIFFSGILILLAVTAFGQVEGDVLDEKNKAVTNAVITATDSTGKIVDTVRTDQRGFYFFKKLKPGKYKIEAKAPGFLPAVYKNVEVNAAPAGANEGDDTYYAITLDITLIRTKVPK